MDVSLLSDLSIRGMKSSIFGFVVPIGMPKYVKGIVARVQPKVDAICSACSIDRIMLDFL